MLKCKTILQQYLINVVNKISKSRQDLEFVCVKKNILQAHVIASQLTRVVNT